MEAATSKEGCTTACCLKVYRNIMRPLREEAAPSELQPNARVH